MHGKNRKYIVYISVSCSGPEQPKVERVENNSLIERNAASLEYTTADSDWFYEHLHEDAYVENQVTKHIRLVNPTSDVFASALLRSLGFLNNYISEIDWDGGSLVLIYAGHGQEKTGALVFNKASFPLHAQDMLSFIDKNMTKSNRRLRIDAILDSCYSGAFISELIWSAHNCFDESIFPCTLFSASLPNETAREFTDLGHGVFTYSYIQEVTMPPLLLQKNKFGLSENTSNTSGGMKRLREGGVNFITKGEQNSFEYENGCLDIHGAGSFDIEKETYTVDYLYSEIKKASQVKTT